ncbi:hypothetical protein CVT24_008277 [Panaeolus cyanescens]|uniref:Uncharacterized protein n=1 Tax=Panaeolus cyanescens TaxID=181874 RepID=A0A409WTS8_9AGAR|nr:hypothetical protein CVT24_008277 [Panaeolus cyanescens]
MSTIQVNITYALRYVPADANGTDASDIYTTATGYGEPVQGQPRGVAPPGAQSWFLSPVEGKEDVYKITSAERPNLPFTLEGPDHVLPSWGLPGNKGVPTGHHDPILLKVCEVEWRIKQDEGGYHTISPVKTDGRLGVVYYVDFDERLRILYIKGIPVIRDPPPAPKWELIC